MHFPSNTTYYRAATDTAVAHRVMVATGESVTAALVIAPTPSDSDDYSGASSIVQLSSQNRAAAAAAVAAAAIGQQQRAD